MIKYRNNPHNNIVEISVEGKISEADCDPVIAQLKDGIAKHGKLRILRPHLEKSRQWPAAEA